MFSFLLPREEASLDGKIRNNPSIHGAEEGGGGGAAVSLYVGHKHTAPPPPPTVAVSAAPCPIFEPSEVKVA